MFSSVFHDFIMFNKNIIMHFCLLLGLPQMNFKSSKPSNFIFFVTSSRISCSCMMYPGTRRQRRQIFKKTLAETRVQKELILEDIYNANTTAVFVGRSTSQLTRRSTPLAGSLTCLFKPPRPAEDPLDHVELRSASAPPQVPRKLANILLEVALHHLQDSHLFRPS